MTEEMLEVLKEFVGMTYSIDEHREYSWCFCKEKDGKAVRKCPWCKAELLVREAENI